jgi:RNA polymerase sigma factor (sigma-70 family)
MGTRLPSSPPPPDAAPEPSNDVDLPPLTAEQEALVQMGLPLVARCAAQMARRYPRLFTQGDMLGAGTLGLLTAARSFDAERHLDFVHHARGYVLGRMLNVVEGELFTTRARVEHAMDRAEYAFSTHQILDVDLFADPEETLRDGGEKGCEDALSAAFVAAAFVASIVASQDLDPEDALILRLDLRRALSGLDPFELQMIQLVDEEGLSILEAAKRARIHANTAQKRHTRALAHLGELLLEERDRPRRR